MFYIALKNVAKLICKLYEIFKNFSSIPRPRQEKKAHTLLVKLRMNPLGNNDDGNLDGRVKLLDRVDQGRGFMLDDEADLTLADAIPVEDQALDPLLPVPHPMVTQDLPDPDWDVVRHFFPILVEGDKASIARECRVDAGHQGSDRPG